MTTCQASEIVFVDYHVNGLRSAVDVLRGRSQLAGVSLSDSQGRCQFFLSDPGPVVAALGNRHRVYHDALFSLAVEWKYGFPLAGTFDCVKTAAHLLDETASCAFDDLLQRHADELRAMTPAVVHGTATSGYQLPHNSASLAWLLHTHYLQPRRLAAEQLDLVYRQIELPVVDPTIVMAQSGLKIDTDRLLRIRSQHEARGNIIDQQLARLVGRRVQMGNDDDVRRLLFDELRLPKLATTPTGEPSIDREALTRLRHVHPAIELVIEGRQLWVVATAAKSLLGNTDPVTGRVYPYLDPLGAATGRFTCSSPNLHGLIAVLREVIVADEGYLLAELDFSQMELRVLAWLSQDPGLCAAFARGDDIHQATAAALCGLATERVTHEQRQIGKAVNFGIIYGQGAAGLADELAIPIHQADEWIASFNRAYPSATAFLEAVRLNAARHGFVITWFGRRRRLIQAQEGPRNADYHRALRQATNTVIQGTAADLNKLALVRLFQNLPLGARILLSVHDSFLLAIPIGSEAALPNLRAQMEWLPAGWTMPLPTSVGTGQSWSECKVSDQQLTSTA